MIEATSVLNEISGALSSLITQIQSNFPDHPSFAEHWGWQQPGITKHDFVDKINKTINLINIVNKTEIDESLYDRLSRIPATINFMSGNTIPNTPGGNFYIGYSSIYFTLESIESLIEPLVPKDPGWQEIQDRELVPAKIKKRLDTLQRGIGLVEKQSTGIREQIDLINEAYQAANALPASLAGLEDAQLKFEEARNIVDGIRKKSQDSLEITEKHREDIERNLFKSRELTGNISEVYSAATRQGLGKSFQERADALKVSTYVLMIILAMSLGIAGKISHNRINYVEKLLSDPALDLQVLWANVILTGIGVAAPIWFAWLLTKQISQRFRLAEDYGFKASVAKAYEGYRRETEETGDPELRKRLLSIALDRVEEAPLSHIEREHASTPLQDLINSVIKNRSGKSPEK